MNWSHFKPDFSGNPEEDEEAHLLHTNDGMNVHHFVEGTKVQRFCLTLHEGTTILCMEIF